MYLGVYHPHHAIEPDYDILRVISYELKSSFFYELLLHLVNFVVEANCTLRLKFRLFLQLQIKILLK